MTDFDVNSFVDEMDMDAGVFGQEYDGLDELDMQLMKESKEDADEAEDDDWTEVWVFSHSDWVDGGDGFLYEYHFYYD